MQFVNILQIIGTIVNNLIILTFHHPPNIDIQYQNNQIGIFTLCIKCPYIYILILTIKSKTFSLSQ